MAVKEVDEMEVVVEEDFVVMGLGAWGDVGGEEGVRRS